MRDYSQFGEQRLILKALEEIGHGSKRCCEFGCRGANMSNTAILVERYGYWGKFMDARPERLHIGLAGGYETEAAWVTAENINELLPEDLHVLSIDIDGNDYWVWQAIDQRPPLVIIEYIPNVPKGYVHPYDPEFALKKNAIRGQRPHAGSVFGASSSALRELAEVGGYREVGVTPANLIFARLD